MRESDTRVITMMCEGKTGWMKKRFWGFKISNSF